MLKRIIAGALSASLIISATVTGKLDSLVAEQTQPSAANTLRNQGCTVEGKNSLGKMIGEAYTDQQNEGITPLSASASELTFEIADVVLDRESGKITVCSTQSLRCDILVSVIDDDNKDHVISFSRTVEPGADVITEIDLVAAELPEFFNVRAVLADNSGKELSGEKYYNQYTHFMQTMLNSTVEDFEEQYVVNLDEDNTTNFFVLSEDTIVAESSENVNTLVSADYDSNTFVFDNADETILSLHAGECFYAQPNDKDIIAVSVESIETTDEGVVIKGNDAGEDIFEFVKIETDESTASAPELVDPEEETDVFYNGYEKNENGLLLNYSSNILSDKENKFSITNYIPIDIEKEIELTPEFKPKSFNETTSNIISNLTGYDDPLSQEKLEKGFSTSTKVGLKVDFSFFKYKEVTELSIDGSLGATLKFSVSGGYSTTQDITEYVKDFDLAALTDDVKNINKYVIDIPDLAIDLYGVGIGFAPTLTFGVKGSVSASVSFAIDFSVYYDSQTMEKVEMDSNIKRLKEGDELTDGIGKLLGDTKTTFAANGDVYATFDPGLGIWPVTSKIGGIFISTPVTLDVGVSANIENTALNNSEITYRSFNTSNPMHYCPICFDQNVKLELGVSLKAVLLKFEPLESELASKTIDLGKWYYSPFAEGTKFGAGSCPHKAKKVKMFIKGNYDYRAPDLEVFIDDDFKIIPESDAVVNGNVEFYSKVKDIYGNYIEHTYAVKSDDQIIAEGTFIIDSDSTINITITKTADDDTSSIEKQKIENINPTEAPTDPPYVKPKEAKTRVTPGREKLNDGSVGENTWYSAFTDNGTGYIDISGYGEITGSISSKDKPKITHAAVIDEASFIYDTISDDTVLDKYIYENRDELIADYVDAKEDKDVDGDEKTIEKDICSAPDRDKKLKEFITDNIDKYRTPIKEFKSTLVEDADDLVITSIGPGFFDGCENLETVILPANLERIEPAAFKNCSKLSSITYEGSPNIGKKAIDLPPTLKFIGESAFEGCSSLEGEFILSDKIEEVCKEAFKNCSGLTNIVIPNPDCKMEYSYHFFGCDSLTEITVPWLCNNYYNKFGGKDCVPASLKKITVVGGKNIPGSALEDFNNLETVVLPADVEDIGSDAFKNCTSLKQITYAGSKNTSKSAIDLPNTLITISSNAFENCISLAGKVTLPSSLENIRSYAFLGCSGLTGELIIPESVKEIGVNSLHGTSHFTGHCFDGCSGLTKITILNPSCSIIYDNLFIGCSSLKELTVPTVTESFTNQFGGVEKAPKTLKKITVLSATDNPSNDLIIKAIPNTAFENFSNLETVVLPADVEDIGSYAFKDCTNLKQITYAGSKNSSNSPIDLPNTVLTIGTSTFANCTSLAGNVTLPSSLENIRSYAFSGCSSLTGELIIPKSIKNIGEHNYYGTSSSTGHCFENCSGLTKIAILNPSCSIIYYNLFIGCSSLEEVTVPTVTGSFISQFGGVENVPKTLKKITVLSATDFDNNGQIIKTIPGTAFEDFTDLETIVLPADLVDIGSFAFKNCTSLKSVTYAGSKNSAKNALDLPPTVKSIGIQAFINDTALTGNLRLSDSIEYVDERSFEGCTGFESITVPDGVTTISGGARLVENCSNVKSVYIPTSMKHIDVAVFGSKNEAFGTVCYGGTEEDWNKIEILEANDAILKDKNEALEFKFDYVPEAPAVSTRPGDANGDGIINVADAVAVLQYIANRVRFPLDEQGIINADIDGSPGLTGGDVIAIQKIDAGILVLD